jgi:peptidoglycan hydrolase CwlO-like protein
MSNIIFYVISVGIWIVSFGYVVYQRNIITKQRDRLYDNILEHVSVLDTQIQKLVEAIEEISGGDVEENN